MPRVIHFEIQADEPERAAEFYKNVFGWKIDKWEGPQEYWLATTGEEGDPGINGAITKRVHPGTTNTIDVPSVDEYVKKIEESGGKATTPKTAIPGIGYFAYCEDTEGNAFGIMESDESVQ